jgi:D-alanine-D-alanine ligase
MEACGFPCIVKPAAGGSSFGVTLVKYARDIDAAIDAALAEGDTILIEEFLVGQELTCGVLEVRQRLMPLAVTLIRPLGAEFFDYRAKYSPGAAEEITPAPLPADDTCVVQSAAMIAHKALGCAGYSRADFILCEDGRLAILEVNTLPGMTRTSLLPQGAAGMGIDMKALVGHMIAAAARRTGELPFGPQSTALRAPRTPGIAGSVAATVATRTSSGSGNGNTPRRNP